MRAWEHFASAPFVACARKGIAMYQKKRTYRDEAGDGIYRRIYVLVSMEGGGWGSRVAIFGLAGGLFSVPLAMLLWVLKFIAPIQTAATLNEVSNILFALALPLLALGACCLDLLESKSPSSTPPGHNPISLADWRHLRPRDLRSN